jgi:hypothetical protein
MGKMHGKESLSITCTGNKGKIGRKEKMTGRN